MLWFMFHRKLWQWSFVASSDGRIIDTSHYPAISPASIMAAINFTSPRKEQYAVEGVTDTTSYGDLFELNVIGRHSRAKEAEIKHELVTMWNASKFLFSYMT